MFPLASSASLQSIWLASGSPLLGQKWETANAPELHLLFQKLPENNGIAIDTGNKGTIIIIGDLDRSRRVRL